MYYALPASLLINVILVLLLVVVYLRGRKNKPAENSPKLKSTSSKSKTHAEPHSGNPLAQARELLAQNKVAQAVGFCEIQLDQDPANHDLRLFLMAIYVKTRQADAFENQYDIICHQADAETISKANALRARFEVTPNDIPKSKIDAIQSERSSAKTAITPAESASSNNPTSSQIDSDNFKALDDEPRSSSEGADELDNIDFDLEPSLDQTLLDLENEMTQTAMTNVSLTNLKITIDEDISDQVPEADSLREGQDFSLDIEDPNSSSTDETSETASIDFEPSANAIEFESKNDENPTGSLSLDDISYELDITDETDEPSSSINQEATDSDQHTELKLSPADDDIGLEESGDIDFVTSSDQHIPTLDQPADSDGIPTLDQQSQPSPDHIDFDMEPIKPDNEVSKLESDPDTASDEDDFAGDQSSLELAIDTSEDAAYQLDMDDDSMETMDDGDTFDFGEALAGDALDQIELDSAESEPGTFDLSMQFEAVDQPQVKFEAEQESESISLEDELNFGFSLEPEVNSSTDTKTDFSLSLDEDEPELTPDPSDNPVENFDKDSSDFLEIAETKEGDIQTENALDSDQAASVEPMPDAEFDFDFEEADTEEEPTLISPALSEPESSATPTISGDNTESDDIDDDWFASLDREFSDIDSGESTHVNLKLAKEYIRLGEKSGAQSLLEDVIENGADDDRQQAQKLLDSM